MVSTHLFAVAAAGLLFNTATSAMYTKNSPVLQLDSKNFDKLITKSNHISIVEFYAPWCGHCQNLKPAYEKAAKSLTGLANVAAIDCDDDSNKPLCGQYGVQGFPTLKIFTPTKKPGKPAVSDYNGARSAKAIVDELKDKIPNKVQKITDKTLAECFSKANDTAKAILFTEKGTTSALLKAVAIDFVGSITIAQIRNTQKEAIGTFGIESFPTLVLLPGGSKDSIIYDGELNKDGIVKFLSQIAEPNAGCPVDHGGKPRASKKDTKKESKPAEDAKPSKEDAPKAEDAPPVVVNDSPPLIEMLEQESALQAACLQPKSNTCILALLPAKSTEDADALLSEDARKALASLSEIHAKHDKLKTKLFPFYSVPASNSAALRQKLDLADESKLEVVAINAKRNWWRHFGGGDFGKVAVEDWIDAIRMGDGKKARLPKGLVQEEEAIPDDPIEIKVDQVVEDEGHSEL